MGNRSFIGVGSNLDDKLNYMIAAIDELKIHPKCELVKTSSFYETKPYGFKDQDNFLNSVVELNTSLSLCELFELTKEIEKKIGRVKREKWGPREIDLDILFYNNEIYNSERLNIPHKDILKRDFVLVPLIEIAPDFVHPGVNKKISAINLDNLEENIIRKIDFLYN